MQCNTNDEKMTETYKDGDIIYSEFAGISDIVIEEPYTGYFTTANEILRMITLNDGYTDGNIWETDRHRFLIKKLLDKAYAAVLEGDTDKADLYLSMDYWNAKSVDKMIKGAERFKQKNEMSSYNYITHFAGYANTNFRCKALYAALWHKHIGLLNYVLSKINPCNISDEDFNAARVQGLVEFICNKDPTRYYMKKSYVNGLLTTVTPMIRTPEKREEYIMQQQANYEALAIHRFAQKTAENIAVTGLPTDVMRFIITMVKV